MPTEESFLQLELTKPGFHFSSVPINGIASPQPGVRKWGAGSTSGRLANSYPHYRGIFFLLLNVPRLLRRTDLQYR